MTMTCPSSKAIRKSAGSVSGRRAVIRKVTDCPARTRVAASRATSPSSCTLPVLHRRRTSAQLLPGSRRRSTAASVAPASAASTVAASSDAGGSDPAPVGRDEAGSDTYQLVNPIEGLIQVLRLAAAALGHVGPPAALAAERLGDLADDLAGVNLATRSVVTIATSATLSPSTPASTMTPEPQLVAQLVADLAQRLGIGDVGRAWRAP